MPLLRLVRAFDSSLATRIHTARRTTQLQLAPRGYWVQLLGLVPPNGTVRDRQTHTHTCKCWRDEGVMFDCISLPVRNDSSTCSWARWFAASPRPPLPPRPPDGGRKPSPEPPRKPSGRRKPSGGWNPTSGAARPNVALAAAEQQNEHSSPPAANRSQRLVMRSACAHGKEHMRLLVPNARSELAQQLPQAASRAGLVGLCGK